ncbi:hypothetical protein C2869_16205 [Saccharobesus litoralis]|uniref:Uncharacterized protein n=1 Tax=Saccharobesus litoralis TaxID=2172099 RepID=A0A2S0VUH9_9ALTE|nr:hypothetical protein [Saccharobesus litoralis]AWB67871.1 hypothetical protein C2869_16205 [Saccharobesus litoralis]
MTNTASAEHQQMQDHTMHHGHHMADMVDMSSMDNSSACLHTDCKCPANLCQSNSFVMDANFGFESLPISSEKISFNTPLLLENTAKSLYRPPIFA